MFVCRVSLATFVAAHALRPVTVQYELPFPEASEHSAAVEFEARAARLEDAIATADSLWSGATASSTSFVSLGQGAVPKVAARFPKASDVMLRTALSASVAQALEAEGMPASEGQCVRDYNAPCPLGWIDHGDGGTCAAPITYDGPCGNSLDFKGMAAHEKMSLAESCGVAFACVGACVADFAQTCPQGWSLDSTSHCAAPRSYAGPCVGRKDFARFAWADKAVFETTCAVRWPCRLARSAAGKPSASPSCDADYSQDCPLGWASVAESKMCVAPSAYNGFCSLAWPAGMYTAEEKRAIAENCGARWPCRAI